MRPATLAGVLDYGSAGAEIVVIEGVMGLFDGAVSSEGSTADLAAKLDLPVVLVIDAARQSQSIAALVHGFRSFRDDVVLAGVILNRVSSPKHEMLLRNALAPLGLPVLAALPPEGDLTMPSRHLGLVQAEERDGLDFFLDRAADWLHLHLDRAALEQLLQPLQVSRPATLAALPPLGQHIAVARDAAFAFAYPHILEGWKSAGASITFFSPLADDPVPTAAEGVYLPGGYPELHTPVLDKNQTFLRSLRDAASRGAAIYGECGGFMVLGKTLTDENGDAHQMAGLLPVHTSFAERKLHLGYRTMVTQQASALGPAGQSFKGHEFHYASLSQTSAAPLFRSADALGETSSLVGCVQGTVCGSFLHIIDAS